MILETIPAIQALTVDQKLRLVWEIWNEVSHASELSPGVGELLDRRIAEYEANPSAARTTDEVTAGILALKARLAESRR
jgi:putative addiction module component (TIGR02574 family)